MRPLLAQVRAETWMTLRRGETLLLTVGIPVVFVVFFSEVHVLPTGHESAVAFVVPGVLALAVMSTAMVSLGIATGFERGYGVLKRLGSTPLRRDRLVAAKIDGKYWMYWGEGTIFAATSGPIMAKNSLKVFTVRSLPIHSSRVQPRSI